MDPTLILTVHFSGQYRGVSFTEDHLGSIHDDGVDDGPCKHECSSSSLNDPNPHPILPNQIIFNCLNQNLFLQLPLEEAVWIDRLTKREFFFRRETANA